ncbi:ferritin-like domain-containing protein [Gordonia soli]|uniref:Ferritin-like domain-containing protein n=1 Tax=Gordonia soli NBRC 108243 TaxID=1223545 RepID=M0QFE0_9ACTN|nr:ferritin-like domain-containing protein [Gordonia soli]GAC67288.1 hypothetical protein GS4_07_00370 [Gordonia soli NBRC 108243]
MSSETPAGGSGGWSTEFVERAVVRARTPDPRWSAGCRLHPAVVRSLQKFEVGESGDGANLIANAARTGDADYERAIRLFVAEEQNHARMLGALLTAGGAETGRSHWSDSVFVVLRRAMGLKLELMVLTIAEVVALRYYRALADGGGDPLLVDVSERILHDEYHHVAFQANRIRAEFAGAPRVFRNAVKLGWRAMATAVVLVVAADHGAALRACGVSRGTFVADTMRIFERVVRSV